MRIAFLVVAHTDAKQVENLVDRLAPNEFFDSAVFLHVDAKSDISQFYGVAERPHVRLTDNRVDVVRCGISQVEAALELIKTALDSGEVYDRYVLITGQDYPVVSNYELSKTLELPCEFMRGYRVTGNSMNVKVKRYYFYRRALTGSSLRNLVRRVLQMLCKPFSKKDTVTFNKEQWDVYYSSAYFAVSYPLLCELYEKGRNKGYFNYFKTAICSDEMYFITIAANGAFRDKLEVIDNPSHTLLANSAITYFDYQNRPTVVTEKDYEDIKKSKRLFARKFSSRESVALMDLLKKDNASSGD